MRISIIDKLSQLKKSMFVTKSEKAKICPQILLKIIEIRKNYCFNDINFSDSELGTNLWKLDRFVIQVWVYLEHIDYDKLERYLRRCNPIIKDVFSNLKKSLPQEEFETLFLKLINIL